MNTVLVTIPCEAGELAEVRARLRKWLAASDVPEELQDAIVLATHEAATNAIEHAKPCTSLHVRASIEARVLTVDVTDTGQWTDAAFDDDEGGRGLILIRELINEVQIRPSPSGTTIHLRQPL